ncbi:hypothetical protein RSAG8_08409, partial [Rhizoctonia solani AG-8 WAC10335]
MSGSYSNPLHLPIFPETRTHQVLIDGELREEIVSQANQLPSDVKDEVLELIDKYNEFASHLPAETELGAWAGHAVPLLFSVKRPTQVPTANFFLRCYLPLSYYLSIIQAQKEGTLPYFEMWIDIIFARDLLYHGPSSTLLGGVTGCIWAVLGVVLILFNIAYVRGDAKPLFSPPEAYDTTRLPSSEWDRVRQWCRKLTEALIRSTQTLSPTSPYRLKGVQPTAPAPSDVDLTPEDNLRSTTPLETAPAQTSTTSRELTKRLTLAAVELVKSTEPLGDDEPALGDLNNLGIRLRAKMVEARWIYDDMMDYAHLATRMSREMDWFPDPSRRPAPDSPDIRKCAIWCMKWAKATEELEDLMLAFRRKYWRITGRPFETNFGKPSQYKFGNAIKEEWHQALEACLALGPAPTLNSAPDATAPTPNSVSAPNNPSPTTSAIPPGETATDIPTPVAASSPPVSNSNLPIVDTGAQTKDGQTTDAMEVDSSTHAPGKGPDMSGEPAVTTDPAISAPVPAAGHTAKVQQAAVAEPRRTRADSKRKVEETQRVTRNTRRKN